MGLASALAGIAGVFLGGLYFASPQAGDQPLLIALIVVIFGGLGSLPGTVYAAYAIGFIQATAAVVAGIAALVVLVAAFPLFYRNQYVLTVIVTGLVLLVLNISWNFVLGVAGVWNFGQLAIYALGGYGAGILMLHTPLPPWLAVLGGG